MKVKKRITGFSAMAGGLSALFVISSPAWAANIPVNFDKDSETKETLEIYGKVRLSLDYADSDLGDAPESPSKGLTDGSLGLSTNTTIIGFRGSYGIKDQPYTVVWQLEQNFDPDTDAKDTLANRDTFLGIKTPAGLFRVGRMDTPFKRTGIGNSLYVTTVGDPMAILGQSSAVSGRLDLRGANSLYWNGELAGVKLAAQYALDQDSGKYTLPDGSSAQGTKDYIDDNESDMYSVSAAYTLSGFTLSSAYIKYSEIYGGEVEGWRAGLRYKTDRLTLGGIYENIDTDDTVASGSLSRSAYGLYASYRILPRTTVGAQWMHADESDLAAGDDGADQFTLAVYQQVFKPLRVYFAATTTKNDDNGQYRSGDYAHGDKIATVPGGDPMAVSVGAEFVF
ncbi:porin [Alloalcanivorax xenomutans]|uniref:porin n=1 Tax=Alloalcanivorax xenomutans TaxID=1094342 RepID=UPI0011AB8446|nr:porin [Alloalcanivorax xenomutans]MCE7522031.1 porin [Alloalcanivorax xenomutans]